MARQIEHEGEVVEQRGDILIVEILSKSACASCTAKGVCMAADEKKKRIEVPVDSGYSFSEGDRVVVVASSSVGMRAVALAYVAPVVLVVAVLLVCLRFGVAEALAAVVALAALVPYFTVIYFLRKRLRKSLVFRVRKWRNLSF